MKKYMVVLSYYRAFDDMELKYKEYDNIDECIKAIKNFIKKYKVAPNQWQGGNVYSDNKYIGLITYNGDFVNC